MAGQKVEYQEQSQVGGKMRFIKYFEFPKKKKKTALKKIGRMIKILKKFATKNPKLERKIYGKI